jgi:SAM-dependent methyltransferase
MDAANFCVEAEVERTHWWFSGRRRLFARELTRIGIGRNARILDVGTGTGANLRMLRELKLEHVTGLDSNELAIQFCASKGLGLVRRGDICAMPFAPESFDVGMATDVIEHVDDDKAALAGIARVLRSGGNALISVPAFPSLWGLQDIVAHHKRRYRLRPLLQIMREGGLEPYRYYHFNYLLFAPIWIARQLIRCFGLKANSEAEFNTPVVNRLLSGVFRIDIRTAPVLRLPFGVSILVIARKAQACEP